MRQNRGGCRPGRYGHGLWDSSSVSSSRSAAFGLISLLLTRWPRVLLARGPVPVAVLAAAAAAGAVFAPGEPTALTAVDVVLKAAFAAAVTAASARARRQAWLFASTATVIAGVGATFDWFAFAATGATMALVVLGRRSWVVGALIGACVVQVLLRLDLGGTTGTSAAVAGAVGALLVVSGLLRARCSTRRRAWITSGVLAGSGGGGQRRLRPRRGRGRRRRPGRDRRRPGRTELRRAGQVAEATAVRDRATTSSPGGRWPGTLGVRPALAVPIVGQQVRAVRTLSRAGEDLAGAAASASTGVDLKGLRLEHGAIDLAAVDRAAGALGSARRALDGATVAVETARSPWLVSPLVDAIRDLCGRMGEARRDVGTASEVLDLAGPMLGRDGPRRYFVAVVTPAENRGSGGLIGNTGVITATGGKLDLAGVQRVARLNEAVDDAAAAAVLPRIYADAYAGWKVPAKLQNVTVAADFPLPPKPSRPSSRWPAGARSTGPSASTRWPWPPCSKWWAGHGTELAGAISARTHLRCSSTSSTSPSGTCPARISR